MPKKKKSKKKKQRFVAVSGNVKRPAGLLDVPDIKMRVCLKCSNEFESCGPGNRLCVKCGRENKSVRTSKSHKFGG
jgi:hypothetical protein